MTDIIFEVLKLLVMVMALIVTTYLIPFLREKVGAEKLADVEKWVKFAVLKAQQVMQASSGKEKKLYVVEFVRTIVDWYGLLLTSEQIDILIESAVKQMKIEEKANESK